MTARRVTDTIYRIPLAWSMAYVLRAGRDVTLIDCGLQRDHADLLAALRELDIAPADVRVLLLTHGHCDHAGNAAYFAAQGATIMAHHAEALFIEPPRRSYAYRGLEMLRRPFTSLAFEVGEVLYPVQRCRVGRVVTDGEILDVPGGPLRVVHTPGHTPGHIAFLLEQSHLEQNAARTSMPGNGAEDDNKAKNKAKSNGGILFSGDAVLNIIPVKRETGLSLPMRLLSDDWAQARQSARRLADLAPRLLLAGHGPPLADDTARRLQSWANLLPHA